ncbi:MAG TPA: ABC transporter permease [Frankiaceae bacterium]|nr:ABC transporter permease [Trebonia sp.]HEX4430702.1 ABC transporter permease [Frankiaceae bacterium]
MSLSTVPVRLARSPRTREAGRVVLAKLVHAVVVIFLAYSASFLLLFVLPGNAVLARIGTTDAVGAGDISAMSGSIQQLREQLGLTASLWQQYLAGLDGLVHGSLGHSLVTDQSVTYAIGQALPSTLELAGVSLLFSVPIGFLLAVLAVNPRSRLLRSLAALVPSAYLSLPVFWVGIMFIYIFSIKLGWFPSNGTQGVASLVLPATVLSLLGGTQFAQVLISSLRTEVAATYASVTAPAKGASRLYTVYRHCLRNASFPFLAVFGLRVGSLLGGTVIIEVVFSRNGIGSLIITSVENVDLTVVLGLVVLLSVMYVLINALVDIGYVLLDPRLRRPAVVSDSVPEVSNG